jgi:phytoene dehydrogenase-like protein
MLVSARADSTPDAIVVGSGPNGLTAAVLLARAGLSVRVIEVSDRPGGGCRSAEVTRPGFVHDLCSAVHPMGALSPVFRDIGLEKLGLTWVSSDLSLAHPLPDGMVATLERSLAATSASLGRDGPKWEAMMRPFAEEEFVHTLLQPVWQLRGGSLIKKARFGFTGIRSAGHVAQSRFEGEAARALFAGCAAHSVMALDRAGTAAFGLVLAATAHVIDWPCARGGSREIAWALVRALESFGGEIELNTRVSNLGDIPNARAVLFDLSPRQVASICGGSLPVGYREKLARFRHGPGVFKIDYALRCPIPWRNPECHRAMTVHVGGTFAEVLRSDSRQLDLEHFGHGDASSRERLVSQPLPFPEEDARECACNSPT